MKIYYKVLEENRISVAARGRARLTYPVGKKVEALKNTVGIFIFKDIDSAKCFRNGIKKQKIVQCVAHGKVRERKTICYWSRIEDFFRCKKDRSLADRKAPYGTLVANAITCLE